MSAQNLGHHWKKLSKSERRRMERSGQGFAAALARVCKNCGATMGPNMGVTPKEECGVLVARKIHES